MFQYSPAAWLYNPSDIDLLQIAQSNTLISEIAEFKNSSVAFSLIMKGYTVTTSHFFQSKL